jgi:small subunit ribosomal protein S8e
MPVHQKKRKFEMGRPAAMTKLGGKRVRPVRCRGGNYKYRALRIDIGNFAWGSESLTRKCRVLDVVYNATNNELVRTKTVVKNCIISIDCNPFRQWYLKHYDVELNKKKLEESDKARAELK